MPDPVRTALVTGGGARIGNAIVRDLAAHGWAVAIHANSSVEKAGVEAARINGDGGSAAVIRADLSDLDAVRTILPEANDKLGPVTLLVNNAAIFARDAIGELDAAIWQAQFAVNLRAPVFLAEAFAAQLPDGQDGNIVNMIDHRVWKLRPDMTSYTLAKSALSTATCTLAQALAPQIRVNAIGPGPVLPDPYEGEAGLAREAEGTLLKRRVDIADFGRAVRFLVETRSMTGQMLALDSGQHLAWRTPDVISSQGPDP
jgi:NAD(P)-dependent dehydrogenase (short-subunit alcohol dehydrogenase family)